MQSTQQGPWSPSRSIDHLLDEELLGLKFDWQPRAEHKEDASGDGREHGSRKQGLRSPAQSNGKSRSEARPRTTHRRMHRSSAGVNQRSSPHVPTPPTRGADDAGGRNLHTPLSPRQAFIGSVPPGSQRSQSNSRIYKTAVLLLQLKKMDAARRREFRGRAEEMPISVLDESFAVHLEKMGFSEMEIENSFNKGGILPNLPDLSDDGVGKKVQLDEAAPFTLWANGAKIRLTPKERRLISKAWDEMDQDSAKIHQKAVHSNYPMSPRKSHHQTTEYLVAPNIWRDVNHQQSIELKKSQLLSERKGISSSTNSPSFAFPGRPATAPVPQSHGMFSMDRGISGEGGVAMAQHPHNLSRPTTCPTSFAPRGSSPLVPPRLLHPGTRKNAALAPSTFPKGGSKAAADERPRQGDGSVTQHEQQAVASPADSLNLYSSGVYRNYLWRKGYRVPKPYIPTSHTWENPALESDENTKYPWEATADIPHSEVSYQSSPRFM